MKKVIGVFAVVVPIVAVFIAYFLNRNQPELKYTLSSKIPSKFVGSTDIENIQVAEIFNNGNQTAENIQVKISTVVIDYDILKNSFQDSIQVFKDKSNFEITYKSLPPYGSFKIVFKTSNEGIHSKNLRIIYNKGLAEDASIQSSDTLTNVLAIIFFFALILIFIQYIRIEAIEMIAYNANHFYPEKVLLRYKPFFVNDKKWCELRNEAIATLFNYSTISVYNISDSTSYKYLLKDKPIYITDEEWQSIISSAKKKFKEDFSSFVITDALFSSKYNQFFELEKPKNLTESEWLNYIEKFGEIFLLRKKEECSQLYRKDQFDLLFKEDKPKNIQVTYWNKWRKYLIEMFETYLLNEIKYKPRPYIYLKELDNTIINNEEYKFVTKIAYLLEKNKIGNLYNKEDAKLFFDNRHENWLSKFDYDLLSTVSKHTIEFDQLNNQNSFLNMCYLKLLSGIPITEKKPTYLNDEEWDRLIEISEEIISCVNTRKALESSNAEVLKLKEKIEKQLFIIDKCLTEQDFVDKIEEYNNTFAKGNFDNLKKVALILSSKKYENSTKL